MDGSGRNRTFRRPRYREPPFGGIGVSVRDRWLLLDLDGTLLDYERASAAALVTTLADLGVRASVEHRRRFRELNDRRWQAYERSEITVSQLRVGRWRDFLAEVGADIDPRHASDLYVTRLGRRADLITDAEVVLAAVGTRCRLGLITNGFADVQRPRLEASGLLAHAEVVVISDEVGAAKPDAGIFEAAFARMGHPPRDRVGIVGDSLRADVAGGVAYGIETIWFNPTGRELGPDDPLPTYEIGTLQELPGLLEDGRRITPGPD